ncbi:MAG: hypothetical protein OQL27_02875, partial [Sedimenticola sp.]|nr:hypothetical protein [Sedimenticola sp.]
IVLKLEDVAGALARVMSGLRKKGITTMGHSFEPLAEGGKKLILDVEGPVLPTEELRSHLETLKGVAGLLEGGNDEVESPVPAPAAAETPSQSADTRFKNADSEAGDADMRDRMLIFSLLSRYPNISGRLLEIDGSIPEAERAQRMSELGQGFGRHLSKNLKVKGDVSSLNNAIDLLLVPGLSPLVQIAQYSEGLRVSGYTKNMKHAANKPESCDFLAGLMQGLLDSAESLPKYRVEQTQCIHSGAVSCDYRLSPA